MLLIHTWHIIMQTDVGFAVVIYTCGTDFCQVISQSIKYVIYMQLYAFLTTSCLWLMRTRC